MRNLIRTHVGTVALQGSLNDEGKPASIVCATFDPVTDSMFCAFDSSFGMVEIKKALKNGTSETAFSLPFLSAENQDQDKNQTTVIIRDMKYFADRSSMALFFANGDYSVIYTDDGNHDEATADQSIQGAIEGRIDFAQWSPDEEIIALAAGDTRSVLLLTRDIDLIAEPTLQESDLKLSKHVSVGWGKKETQFEGKGAKALRDPTMPVKVDSGIALSSDDGRMRLSWRGDGQYLAVSSLDTLESSKADERQQQIFRRVVRIYARDGTLDGVSEPVDGLEPHVAWKPSGEVIATVQQEPESGLRNVIFFERNGLKRYSFPLGVSKDSQVVDIAWNSDSEILAVQLKDRILLWTMKNYHWYLKQSIIRDDVMWMKWHPEKPYSLFLGLNDGSSIETHSFVWDIISGPVSLTSADLGKTLVIDGNILKVTPFKTANMPPPMALRELELQKFLGGADVTTVTAAAPVHVTLNELNAICVLTETNVIIYKDQADSEIAFNWEHNLGRGIKQVAYCNGMVYIALSREVVQFNEQGDFVNQFDIAAYILKYNVDHNAVVAETVSGRIYSLTDVADSHEPTLLDKLPTRCSSFGVGSDGSVYGLTEAGKLYKGETLVSSSVTSFTLTQKHILFTTAQHYLKICHLNTDTISVPQDSSSDDERLRAIERGSLIVAVIPSKNALVLQAPRGNLETIYPRILVLTEVRRNITEKRYDLAFSLCRVHRIDLNILHDFAPEQLLDNLKLFVKQLKTTEYLDLFLSGLKAEDVSQTMYKNTIGGGVAENNIGTKPVSDSTKVNRICDALLPYLPDHSKLTAYACKTPPDLETALKAVEAESNADKQQSAIQYLCFLQDVELLYRTALSMYNLNMTLLVAQQSQKDPKEYLTFLKNLQKHDELRRKFVIDDYLKNYEKALDSLYQMATDSGDSDELLDYIKRHELYSRAQTLSRYNPEIHNVILAEYAEYLYGNTNYVEAAMCYESLGQVEKAMDAYVIGGQWRQALTIAPKEKQEELSRHLIDVLTVQHHYKDCAVIYAEYLHLKRDAAEMFCQGYAVHDAIRIADGDQDILKSVIDSKLLELYGTITELVVDCKAQIKSQTNRLRELRTKKQENPFAFYGDGNDDTDAIDNVSLAGTESTGGSIFTRYTGKTGGTAQTGASRRTAKNRRREERKKARGKKGSVYEEEYLIKSLARLVERLNETQVDARNLLEGLFRRSLRDHAYQLQAQYSAVIEDMQAVMDEVFASSSEKDRERVDEDGEVYIVPEIVRPVLEPFKKLALLDYKA